MDVTAGYTAPPPFGGPVARQGFGADFAEVRVDPELGTVRATRHV